MLLKKITLHNYRQHKNLSVDFTGNLIAVCGCNGIGKSNFIGAIQFALTGEQPGFDKKDLLSWGEESGYVDLEFTHDGHEMRIQRRIEKPAATLTVDGEKTTGAKGVADALAAHGIDKDVLRQSVFVRQAEIDSVLFTDPRDRELAFQRLIGLGDAAKHNKTLTEYMSEIGQPRDYADDIAHAEEQISRHETQLEGLRRQSSELGARLDAQAAGEAETRAKADTLRSRLELVQEAKVKWDAKDASEKAVSEFVAEHAGRYDGKDEEEAVLSAKVSDLTAELQSAKEAERREENRKFARNKISEAEAVLERLKDLPTRETALEAKQKRMSALAAEAMQLNRLLGAAVTTESGNVCPLCGSTVDHDIRAELEGRKASIDSELAALNAEAGKEASELIGLKKDRDLASQELARWRGIMDGLSDSERETRPSSKVASELETTKKALAEAQSVNEAIRALETRKDVLLSQLFKADSALGEVLSKFPSKIPERGALDTISQRMSDELSGLLTASDTLTKLKVEKAQLDGMVSQLEQSVASEHEALDSLRTKQKENLTLGKRLAVLGQVRDWFAYRNGPRSMTKSVMSLLIDDTNRYLGQFGAAFSVVPMEEGMGFRYVLSDGSFVPTPPPEATMLSGGQKVALAVAFRFAVYSMFAGKLGLLSLDEPTAYLDDVTIGRFGDILGRVRELAKNMGMQVILATHETAILGCADQTIHIGE